MKHIIIPIIISVVALVVALLANVQPPVHLGATVENFPDWFTAGLQIGGTNSKIVTQVNCATKAIALGSNLSVNGTTTFDVALAGAGTSSTAGVALNQVYWVGVNTSTAAQVSLSAGPTSTLGFVTVLVKDTNGTFNGTATTTYSVCYAQF